MNARAVLVGWLVGALVGVVLVRLGGASPLPFLEAYGLLGAVLVLSLSGFAACALGGFVAGRLAGGAGRANGACTALLAFFTGVVLVFSLALGLVVEPDGSAPMYGVSGLLLGPFLALPGNLLAGYLAGKLGERSGARAS